MKDDDDNIVVGQIVNGHNFMYQDYILLRSDDFFFLIFLWQMSVLYLKERQKVC